MHTVYLYAEYSAEPKNDEYCTQFHMAASRTSDVHVLVLLQNNVTM
jgi:hypothetical protein